MTFPALGAAIGFSTTSGEAFGIFAGTAVNDTSSVTAAASTWDSIYHLGTQTLDKAVTVKLTRTLAIIPITLVLAVRRARKSGVGKRREDIAASGISVLHPVFYRSKRDHNGGSGCRRSGRSISSDERSVQVLYRDGDGSDRSSDRCSKTDQKRCETNFDGIVLLDRDYIGVVGTAACYEYLVNDFLRGSRDSMIV